MRSTLAATLAMFLGVTAHAQTLSQSDLVQGQPATIRVDGAAPGDTVAFLLGYSGLGTGPCFPSVGVCLDLLEPFSVLALLPANAQGSATISGVVPANTPLIPVFTQAAVLTASAVLKTNAIAAAFLPLDHLGDDFSGGVLDGAWQILHPEILAQSVGQGSLRLQPLVGGDAVTWFNDAEGPLVYKNVTGDFTVTASVRAYDPANPTAPPPISYRLGGLMVRDPTSVPGNRNFAHVAVGGGTAQVPVCAEDKTTTASNSDFQLYPIASSQGELRITRAGSTISLYFRPDASAPWQLLRAHPHPEFPATLQVGMMVYSNSVAPSIAIEFDHIAFSG